MQHAPHAENHAERRPFCAEPFTVFLLNVIATMNLNAAAKIKKEHIDWSNSWRITNGEVELIVTG